MELLGKEGWLRVCSKRGCSRIQRERREKKRRRHCSRAYLQPTHAEKQEERKSKPIYGCPYRSSGRKMSRRMRENWKEKGAKALTWGVELDFVMHKQKAKEEPHLFTNHTKKTTRK